MPVATPWEKVKTDKLSEIISRQMVSGEDGTLARVLLSRGAPRSSPFPPQRAVHNDSGWRLEV